MNRLYITSLLVFSLAVPGILRSDESERPPENAQSKAPAKAKEKPARRLKGEFKGHIVSPTAESDAAEPASAPKPSQGSAETKASAGKRLTIDNTLVAGGKSAAAKKSQSGPPPPQQASSGSSAAVSFAPVDVNGNGEEYWRAKAKLVRDQLAQAQQNLEAAQQEEKREESDFYSWDDGQYRDNVIKPAWDKSKEDAAKSQDELAAAQKRLEELDDEARRAGAYPGWIRE